SLAIQAGVYQHPLGLGSVQNVALCSRQDVISIRSDSSRRKRVWVEVVTRLNERRRSGNVGFGTEPGKNRLFLFRTSAQKHRKCDEVWCHQGQRAREISPRQLLCRKHARDR